MIALAWCASGLISAPGPAARSKAGIPDIELSGGASSPEALAQAFLAALAANDSKAAQRLAVSEDEYRKLIMPGSVKPGRPPQIMPDTKSEYFWRKLATTSLYTLKGMMGDYGGKKFTLKGIEVQKVEPFAWYTAHRDPVLHVETESGEPFSLRLGSMAEYHGRFKFISFWSD